MTTAEKLIILYLLCSPLTAIARAQDTHQRPPDYTGLWRTFHGNGQKHFEATYVDGIAEGLQYLWYDSGNLARVGVYQRGKEHGAWMWWHADEELRLIRILEHGRTVREMHYEAGEIVADGQYKDGRPWAGRFRDSYYLNGNDVVYHELRDGRPWEGWFWMPLWHDRKLVVSLRKKKRMRTLYAGGEVVCRDETATE